MHEQAPTTAGKNAQEAVHCYSQANEKETVSSVRTRFLSLLRENACSDPA